MNNTQHIVDTLRKGRIVVIGSDTIYGISATVDNPDAVERIYAISHRDSEKAMIVLIADVDDLKKLHVKHAPKLMSVANKYWPGKLSIIFPLKKKYLSQMEYLHRGTNHLAIRLPDKKVLRELIRKTGPLISTSANPQGKTPAHTIDEAREYFGDAVDHYENEGTLDTTHSTLISLEHGAVRVLREGAVNISEQ